MIAAVSGTMQAVKTELDPTTEHSPSLVQVMNASVNTVAGGVNRIAGALERSMPRLQNAALSRAVAPAQRAGVQGGGFQPAPAVQTMNDNRRVDMVVNNNVDMDDLKRNIGEGLASATMNAGGI